jgi:predicted transglutaminase-like cysteine proteinase
MPLSKRHYWPSILFCVFAQPAFAGASGGSYALPPLEHTIFCMHYPHECERVGSKAASNMTLLARWQVINYINSSVNRSIEPNPSPHDPQWLISPLAGECADYAVTKRHELLELGWPSSSLLLAEVTLITTGEHHMILVVNEANADWVLDNLKPVIVKVSDTRSRYWWIRTESKDDPKSWKLSFPG